MTYPHIQAQIVADSLNGGNRLTTFVLTYPRFVHAEVMTHRQFSRNAQSTRAIPTQKRIDRVRESPVLPIAWQKNRPGMQAQDEQVDHPGACEIRWRKCATDCAATAQALTNLGLHKQWAGRMLEPFDTITVILSGTEFQNFFALRCASDAQPEIQELAWRMADLYYNTEPHPIPDFGWHLPFVDAGRRQAAADYLLASGKNYEQQLMHLLLASSAASCARVSYLNHDGSQPDIARDLQLHDQLAASGHFSPFEHQAQAVLPSLALRSNFRGWVQYRKLFSNEVRTFDYQQARKAAGR